MIVIASVCGTVVTFTDPTEIVLSLPVMVAVAEPADAAIDAATGPKTSSVWFTVWPEPLIVKTAAPNVLNCPLNDELIAPPVHGSVVVLIVAGPVTEIVALVEQFAWVISSVLNACGNVAKTSFELGGNGPPAIKNGPAVGVGLGDGATVGLGLGAGVGLALGTGVGLALGTGVGLALGIGVGLALGIGVGDGRTIAEGEGTGVGVGVLLLLVDATAAPAAAAVPPATAAVVDAVAPLAAPVAAALLLALEVPLIELTDRVLVVVETVAAPDADTTPVVPAGTATVTPEATAVIDAVPEVIVSEVPPAFWMMKPSVPRMAICEVGVWNV